MVALPILLLFMIWFWPLLWFRLIRNRIELTVRLERREIPVGGELPLRVTVRNFAWLPCPFVQVTLNLPPGLSGSPDRDLRALSWTTFLFMRQEIAVDAVCYGRTRGVKSFESGSIYARVNDGLGLREIFLSRPVEGEVYVLPSLEPLGAMAPEVREIVGKTEVLRFLHPDETLLRGIREYQAGDPFRQMAWQASARSGKWMTKVFSSSTEASVALLLNAQFFEPYWSGTNTAEFDALCSAAATLSLQLSRRGLPLSFAANAVISRDPKRIWHGRQGPAGVRSLLGRAHPYANSAFVDALRAVLVHAPPGGPLIVFSSFFPDPAVRLLRSVSRERQLILVVGPESEAGAGRVPGARVVRIPSREGVTAHA